jgi:hypothetical protein
VFQGRAEPGCPADQKGAVLRAFLIIGGGRRVVPAIAGSLGAALCVFAPAVARAEPSRRTGPAIVPPGVGRTLPPRRVAVNASSSTLCDATVTGSVDGGLVVPPGEQYCLVGARINGSATVAAGSGAILKESTINGGFSSTEGATQVLICGSHVNGPTTIRNGVGRVLIGADSDDGRTECAGNTLHGGVSISSNVAAIEIEGNRIAGPVTINDNEGPAFEGSDVGAEVELNQIAGPLICLGNSPAPVNDGLPNKVTGPELGQCAGF